MTKTIGHNSEKGEILMEVSIFKTSVINEEHINQLTPILNILVGSSYWNFDLEDIDNILRVYYPPTQNNFLASEIKKYGFVWIELD